MEHTAINCILWHIDFPLLCYLVHFYESLSSICINWIRFPQVSLNTGVSGDYINISDKVWHDLIYLVWSFLLNPIWVLNSLYSVTYESLPMCTYDVLYYLKQHPAYFWPHSTLFTPLKCFKGWPIIRAGGGFPLPLIVIVSTSIH